MFKEQYNDHTYILHLALALTCVTIQSKLSLSLPFPLPLLFHLSGGFLICVLTLGATHHLLSFFVQLLPNVLLGSGPGQSGTRNVFLYPYRILNPLYSSPGYIIGKEQTLLYLFLICAEICLMCLSLSFRKLAEMLLSLSRYFYLYPSSSSQSNHLPQL